MDLEQSESIYGTSDVRCEQLIRKYEEKKRIALRYAPIGDRAAKSLTYFREDSARKSPKGAIGS